MRTYKQLLVATMPAIIESEAENERITKIIEEIGDKGEDQSPDETRLMKLLVNLVEEYEDRSSPIETASPLSVLEMLMDQHDLKQADLVDVFGSSGRVSEVLNGKRAISKTHAKKLASRFSVSAGLFI